MTFRKITATIASAALAGGLFVAAGTASAGNVAWSVSVGGPGYAVTAAGPGYRGYPGYWGDYYGRPYVPVARPYYRPYYPVVYAPPVVYSVPVVYPAPYYVAPRVGFGVVVRPGWRGY